MHLRTFALGAKSYKKVSLDLACLINTTSPCLCGISSVIKLFSCSQTLLVVSKFLRTFCLWHVQILIQCFIINLFVHVQTKVVEKGVSRKWYLEQ